MTAAALLAAFLAAGPACAGPSAGAETPRRVLALYSPELIPGKDRDLFFLPMHQRAELPLNHLGLIVEYVDATGPLPDVTSMAGVRGVVVWFPAPAAFADPRPVCRWLSGAMRAGARVVLLGQVGLYSRGGPPWRLSSECAATLRLLGVEALGTRNVDPLSVSTAPARAGLAGFERKPDPSEKGAVPLARLLPGATAYLRLALAESPPPVTEPVAVTPRGGLALDPFWLYSNEELDPPRFAWVTDPFAFFEAALGLGGEPRPDVTTLSGRRVYMSRVDGDGFFNQSEIDRKKTSGEVFLREFLERFPESPFTVSLIAGYYDLTLYNDAASLALSRRVLRRPNVEAASHGYAHPLVWSEGTVALRIPRYRMDPRREVVEAGRMLETRVLAGAGRVGLMLWTGNCLPGEGELALAEEAGLEAMNGGGGRFDRKFPSYANLLPLTRPVGRRRQVYAAAFNENEYTDLWSSGFYGYRDVLETFRRTESPRRVKPVDVYVHFYSAEKYAALKALHQVFAWARSEPLIPVFSGRYAASVRGFFDMRVRRLGPRRWGLEGGAALRTVRFDGERGVPDLGASRGVIGWRRGPGGSLYVSLDESGRREIALADRAPGPRLEEANFEVEGWKAAAGGVRFRKRGWWRSEATLGGLAPGRRYRVRSGAFSASPSADGQGRLRLEFEDSERGRPASEVLVEPAW